VSQRLYRTVEFNRSFMVADARVREALNRNLSDILARGAYRTTEDDLRAHVIDDWFLYFRYPRAGESYDPDSYVLLRVVRERIPTSR
jgi:hypothetical protein